jgi:protein-tyrosine-phosphatase
MEHCVYSIISGTAEYKIRESGVYVSTTTLARNRVWNRTRTFPDIVRRVLQYMDLSTQHKDHILVIIATHDDVEAFNILLPQHTGTLTMNMTDALYAACLNDSPNMVKRILKESTIQVPNNILQRTINESNPSLLVIDYLLQHPGNHINTVHEFKTPLMCAIQKHRFDIVTMFFKRMDIVNIHIREPLTGKTILMLLFDEILNNVNVSIDMLKMLLDKLIDDTIADRSGRTVLMYAVDTCDIKYVNVLFEMNFVTDIDQVDNLGMSAICQNVTNIDILETLRSNGASVDIENQDGRFVIDHILKYWITVHPNPDDLDVRRYRELSRYIKVGTNNGRVDGIPLSVHLGRQLNHQYNNHTGYILQLVITEYMIKWNMFGHRTPSCTSRHEAQLKDIRYNILMYTQDALTHDIELYREDVDYSSFEAVHASRWNHAQNVCELLAKERELLYCSTDVIFDPNIKDVYTGDTLVMIILNMYTFSRSPEELVRLVRLVLEWDIVDPYVQNYKMMSVYKQVEMFLDSGQDIYDATFEVFCSRVSRYIPLKRRNTSLYCCPSGIDLYVPTHKFRLSMGGSESVCLHWFTMDTCGMFDYMLITQNMIGEHMFKIVQTLCNSTCTTMKVIIPKTVEYDKKSRMFIYSLEPIFDKTMTTETLQLINLSLR